MQLPIAEGDDEKYLSVLRSGADVKIYGGFLIAPKIGGDWFLGDDYLFMIPPGIQNPEGPGLHAVDAPVGVADVVADGDGESAKVCPDQIDGGAGLALDGQRCVLTAVLGPLFWGRTCKEEERAKLNFLSA